MAKRKRKNALVRYFTPFGLRQIGDMSMLLAALLMIIGLFVYEHTKVVIIIGIALFMFGCVIALYRSISILFSSRNRRSPEFKHALVNTVIMGVLLILAIFAMFAAFGVIG